MSAGLVLRMLSTWQVCVAIDIASSKLIRLQSLTRTHIVLPNTTNKMYLRDAYDVQDSTRKKRRTRIQTLGAEFDV